MKSFKIFLLEQDNKSAQEDHVTPLYRALISAEHRGVVKDPTKFDPKLHIRTKYQPKGDVSTAYGPAQMTVSTVQDVLKRHPTYFDKDTLEYTNKFIEQGQKMMKAAPNDPKYGYGCKGDLCDAQFHEPYEKMATAVLKGKLTDAKIDFTKPLEGESLTKGIKFWRGVGETDTVNKKGKTVKGDPEYYKVVRESLPKFSQPQTEPKQEIQQVQEPPHQEQSDSVDYTIQSGDSLSKIAQQNNTTVQDLAKSNNITDINKIKAGSKIKIPKR